MNIWLTLKRIRPKSLWELTKLALKHPLFLYPTVIATKECIRISTLHYGMEHYRNTPANAFRHAFWNYLIAHKCSKWSNTQIKILLWTKAITDWHENAFVNRELPRIMDFHNNDIGRMVYVLNGTDTLDAVIQLLRNKTQNALQIKSPDSISLASDNLVYLYPFTNTTK